MKFKAKTSVADGGQLPLVLGELCGEKTLGEFSDFSFEKLSVKKREDRLSLSRDCLRECDNGYLFLLL